MHTKRLTHLEFYSNKFLVCEILVTGWIVYLCMPAGCLRQDLHREATVLLLVHCPVWNNII